MIDTNRLEQILHQEYNEQLHNQDTTTLTLDYHTLDKYYTTLADQLIHDYHRTIYTIQNTINTLTTHNTHKTVKIRGIPTTPINQIHNQTRGKLISTEGTVRKTSTVYNQIQTIAWTCNNCGSDTVYTVDYEDKITPPKDKCNYCNKKKGYTLNTDKSVFKDVQKFTLQENLEHVQSGFKPAEITGFLEDAQVNTIKPGDKVTVNGVIELRNKNKTNKFREYLLTEHCEHMNKEYEEIQVTPEDVQKFKEYAESHDMITEFKQRIAPTLHGYDIVKEALVLQIFGSDTTHNPDGTYNRGDIHILLIGDPGIGKSQILKSIVNVVPRGIYTSGKSSSGAGLTASAVKDETDNWNFEAGAMVLADKGMVCIDEFDKMRDSDRSAIHEALEQQTISMAKAGNIVTLNSRCSVLAAANPKYGRFNERKSIQEQINLSDTLLSRFDLIFILRDRRDREYDKQVALSILNSTTTTPGDDFDYKKYVSYVRQAVNPTVSEEAEEMLVKYYQDWRGTSDVNDDGFIVTARQFMGLTRLAKASARARLSDKVTVEDVERAVKLENYCLNNTGYSIDETNKPMKVEDKLDKFKELLPSLSESWNNKIPSRILFREADKLGVPRDDALNWLTAMDETGYIVLDPDDQVWSLRDA